LIRQIRQQLTGYGRLGTLAQTLQIEAQNGVVTLSGNVPSQQDRELIGAVIRNTPGVVSLTDQLQTSSTATGSNSRVYSGTQPSLQTTANRSFGSSVAGEIFSLNVQDLQQADRTLAQRIVNGLEADSAVPNLLPKVKINIGDGRVMLSGTVQNEQQRRLIEDAVRRAAGVSGVEDQLQVTGP
jgi:osmotically-inducible protein OsmY